MDESEQIEEQQAFEWAEAERDYQMNEVKNNVAEAERIFDEKYPEASMEQKLLYFEGHMDGYMSAMEFVVKNTKKG